MNAAVMAAGHTDSGAAGARTALEAFWRQVSQAAAFNPLQRGPMDVLLGNWSLNHSPAYLAFDLMARVFSPYDVAFGGAQSAGEGAGRVDRLLETGERADQALHHRRPTWVAAEPRVFRNAELSSNVLLASACLPTMFQAVEIGGEGLLRTAAIPAIQR